MPRKKVSRSAAQTDRDTSPLNTLSFYFYCHYTVHVLCNKMVYLPGSSVLLRDTSVALGLAETWTGDLPVAKPSHHVLRHHRVSFISWNVHEGKGRMWMWGLINQIRFTFHLLIVVLAQHPTDFITCSTLPRVLTSIRADYNQHT